MSLFDVLQGRATVLIGNQYRCGVGVDKTASTPTPVALAFSIFNSEIHVSPGNLIRQNSWSFTASGKSASFRFRYSLIPAGLSRDSLQSSLPLRHPGAQNGVSLRSGNQGTLLFMTRSAINAFLAIRGYSRPGSCNHAAQRGRPTARIAAVWLHSTTRETPPPSRAGGACLFSGKVEVVANHPNRGWRSRWSVDVGNRTATHREGWVFKFNIVENNGEKILAYECIGKPDTHTPGLETKFERVAQEALNIYREQQADK
jgi:hypothetical protein